MASSVLVVGSANMDLVFRCARIPTVGETLLGHGFATHPGGKGANQAVAGGRLGGRVAFAGCVGDDLFGTSLSESLTAAGVDISHLRRSDLPTGTAGILVDDAGRNLIVVAPGANAELKPIEVERAIRETMPAVVLCQLEIPIETVGAAAVAAHEAGAWFALNPAPARTLPSEILAKCDVITPNETEAEALTGIAPVDEEACASAATAIRAMGVRHVVITLGERGAYLADSEGEILLPPTPVQAIDTTAAGDAFNGALATFLAEGRTIREAVAVANLAGALSTTRPGAQESMPTREELDRLAERAA